MKKLYLLNKKVIPHAFTGIASTLLKGGRTLYSTFKFNLKIDETTIFNISPLSTESDEFRDVDVIIIDEISMVNKIMFDAIDLFLRECNSTNEPFGNKLVTVGVDFRQTLPVLGYGSTPGETINSCVNRSNVWRRFKRHGLTTNMRSGGQTKFNEWLLEICNGIIGNLINQRNINIKKVQLDFGKHSTNLIKDVFGEHIQQLSKDEQGK